MRNPFAKKSRDKNTGFSLVEMSIVLVIIGLIVAAVTVGRRTMQNAEYYRAYQKVVVPCLAAGAESMARNNGFISSATMSADIATIGLPNAGGPLSCAGTTNIVTIGNAVEELREITVNSLLGNASYTVGALASSAFAVTVIRPGSGS